MVACFSVLYVAAGEIVNLISVDCQKLQDACAFINMMWSCPLQVGLAIYFLYNEIGVSVFVGRFRAVVSSSVSCLPGICSPHPLSKKKLTGAFKAPCTFKVSLLSSLCSH